MFSESTFHFRHLVHNLSREENIIDSIHSSIGGGDVEALAHHVRPIVTSLLPCRDES
jgi:hypothetical protein